MLKIKRTDRITNDGDFQRDKDERLLLKIVKNRRKSWKEQTVRQMNFCKQL